MPHLVLNYNLCDGDGIVTRITVQDGKVIFRDGKAGTEQGCCCDGGGPNCNVVWSADFEVDQQSADGFKGFLEGLGYANVTYSVEFGGISTWSATCCHVGTQSGGDYTVSDGLNAYTFFGVLVCDNPLP